MEAITVDEFGPAENMHLNHVADPVPAKGQLAIAVEASGVHLVDTAVREGRQLGPFPLPPLPYIPGREVAGTVSGVGPGVDQAWVGKRVAVSLGNANGGYARTAVANADDVHDIGPELSAVDAVAMVGSGRTALGILELAAITADDVVLITAAAGGLGTLFVQEAVRSGATVIALAGGPQKVAIAERFGAHFAVDYTDAEWSQQVADLQRPPTVLLDGVGGTIARSATELMDAGGRVLFFGQSSGAVEGPEFDALTARGIAVRLALGPTAGFTPANIRRWAATAIAKAAAGELVAQVTTFPLAEAAKAHIALAQRATVGKVVLT